MHLAMLVYVQLLQAARYSWCAARSLKGSAPFFVAMASNILFVPKGFICAADPAAVPMLLVDEATASLQMP